MLRVPSEKVGGRFETIALTASIGLATYRVGADRIHDVLQRADKALYEAKAAGRNRVVKDGPIPLTSHAPKRTKPQTA